MTDLECLLCYCSEDKLLCDECLELHQKLFNEKRTKYINSFTDDGETTLGLRSLCDKCLTVVKYPKHLETFANYIRWEIKKLVSLE
jgi:hypothetical protein